MAEIEQPRMFQKPADDRTDPDRPADPRQAGPQAADAAHQQVDRHPRLRRLIEFANAGRIDQRVHLEGQIAVAVPLVPQDLPIDAGQNLSAQAIRGDQQLVIGGLAGVAGQRVEEVRRILAHLVIAGEKAEIGIDPARRRVVVAGSQMQVPPDAIGIPPDDHAELRMRFQPEHSVHHMHPLVFKPPRPLDVVLFVEARL